MAPGPTVGLRVTAVQNPLTSIADSVAATRRALALQDGPTVLVAHSWGGTVISEVGTDPKVSALVYVAARAPDAGEDFVAYPVNFPPRHCAPASRNTTASPRGARTGRRLAVQWTDHGRCLAHEAWYAVSKLDATIAPDLERFLASRMKANIVELEAGHLSLVSHPKEIADLILAAAGRGGSEGRAQ
jgi:pimeloyl-ACP methyl ester carboxylesterase